MYRVAFVVIMLLKYSTLSHADNQVTATGQSAVAIDSSQANVSSGNAINLVGNENIVGESESTIVQNMGGDTNVKINSENQKINNFTKIEQHLETIISQNKTYNLTFSLVLSLSVVFNLAFYLKYKNLMKLIERLLSRDENINRGKQ